MFDQELPVSYYEEISQLNKAHRVSIVRHRETGKICVKKILSVYNPAVYAALFHHPVKQTPRIYALYENQGTLTVIEEYISGDSLEEILEICGPLPEQETIRIAIMLCRILEELHSFTPPLIHRDIKPSNILVTEDGEIVLLDMNAAKFMNTDKAADTRLLGTPGFAAPEQFGFGSSTTATDLYAVGVLMDMLLSGRPATPGLQKIISKCRELDPARRYQSASDLVRDLSALLRADSSVSQNDPLFSHRNGGNDDISSAFHLKRCPVCGKRLPSLAEVCPDCGQKFYISGTFPKQGQETASTAGTGTSAEGTGRNRTPAKDVSHGKQKKLLPYIAAAAFVFLLAAFLFRPMTPAPAAPTETQASLTSAGASPAASETTAAVPASSAAETASAQSAPAQSEEAPAELFGSWKGETGSGLTIDPDGTAVYYCERETFSEPDDPWVYADGRISITLSKLHCVISADTKDGFSELVFTSDSGNWDNERFVKLPQEDPEYRKGALRAFDKAITVLPDGRMEMTFGGVKFTVPKHYLNYPDNFSEDKNIVILSDVNVDTQFIGCAAFQYMDFDSLSILDTSMIFPGFAKEFLYSFFYDVRLTDVKEETIAGIRAFTARFTGETNKGFSGVTGLPSEGIVAFFCDDARGKVVKVVLMQHSESSEDAMPEMEEIIYGVSAL